MHAVLVNVTVNDPEPAIATLREEIVPRVSQATGFVAGYWTRSQDTSNGVSMLVFDSDENAQGAAEMIKSAPDNPAVNIDSVEVREVVANA